MIRLMLSEEQARIVSRACEFYARVRMGQFGEIVWYCSEMRGVDRPQEANEAWLELRKLIYPDLIGEGHSYGYGKFEDADIAYDVHRAIKDPTDPNRHLFSFRACPDCENVDNDKRTNYDAIREKGAEEMVKFLMEVYNAGRCDATGKGLGIQTYSFVYDEEWMNEEVRG